MTVDASVATRPASMYPALAAVAVPPIAGLLVVALFLVAEPAQMSPWSRVEATVSEAAAGGSIARALALIRNGDDPNRPSLVPAGLLDSRAYMVNAIDAAILGRHAELIPVLVSHGAKVGDASRSACLIRAVDLPEALPMIGEPGSQEGRDTSVDMSDAIADCLTRNH